MNFYGTKEYFDYYKLKTEELFKMRKEKTEIKQLEDNYSIEIDTYTNDSYRKGNVCKLYKKEKLIFEWINIYGMTLEPKIINHSNGNKYLIFNEDLYGYSILDLKTLQCMHYLPKESYVDPFSSEYVDTFIFCHAHYNPYNNYLAIEGCIWAAPYTVILLNFDNPMEAVEANKWINISDELDDYYELNFKEWDNDYLIITEENYDNKNNKEIKLLIQNNTVSKM